MKGSGTVVSLNGNKAKVRVTSGGACQECAARSNCQGDKPSEREIVVINAYGAHVSDHVVIEADTGRVILSSAILWILPLLSMIAGYVITALFTSGFWPIGGSFLFFAISFLLLKYINTVISGGTAFYPRITKILDDLESY